MQTDTWLTDATHSDNCPLCSQPLAAGSNTCPSCGFTAHEPVRGSSASIRALSSRQPGPLTPIPARASALRSQRAVGGAFSYPGSSQPAPFSSASSRQAGGLRHDSPNYEAVSSLSSLSLIIAETPTAPPRPTTRFAHASDRRWHIDEIDTVPHKPDPEVQERQVADTPAAHSTDPEVACPPLAPAGIDERDTVPEIGPGASRALQPRAPRMCPGCVDAASWRAGPPRAAPSLAPRFASARSPRRFSPLDHTRWWLLRPGHIEFLLWLAGSVLLFGITFLFLLALVISALLPGAPVGGNFPRSNTSGSSSIVTPPVTGGIRLKLTGSATLASGSKLHLLGQGFRPSSQITFWLDGRRALLDQRGRSALARADAGGRFAADLWLGQGPGWSAGPHQILARAIGNGGQATISISIASPAVTPGSRSNNPGPRDTPPAHPTPIPPHPTPAHPTPPPPRPSPTTGITPTASPSGTNVPATPPSGSPTSVSEQAVNSSSLGNDLHTGDDGSLFARLFHLNPLIWLIGICYLLSLLLLGLAGVFHRRRR